MHDYQDRTQGIEARVDDLLSRMQPEEKLAQLHALWLILSEDGDHQFRDDRFARADAAADVRAAMQHGLGQITRPLGTRSVEPDVGVRALNRLQKFLLTETRLGIPVISHEECLSGLMGKGATLFPSSLAYGATWNPDLIEKVGAAIGAGALSVGCRQGLAPVLDVARDARWGRTEECFAEDPYLTGILASRYVAGLQGRDRQVLATLKHYVGHSFSEGGRNHAPVNLGWRALNDDFMLPFEMAVKLANAGSVMPAYHDIDGEPVHASHHLLTEVLREEWGFDGLIVADYIGVTLLHSHHNVAPDAAGAAALAFGAGLDVELPGNDCAPQLALALARGQIDAATIDESVRRILREKFRLGLFESPYVDEGKIALATQPTIDLAREVAEQAVTILSNDGVLPLGAGQKLAVIGPTAHDPLAMLGDYSFPVHLINFNETESASRVVTPFDGLRAAHGAENVRFAQGCFILEERGSGTPVFPGDVQDNTGLDIEDRLSTRVDMIPEAVHRAKDADVAIVCVGDLSGIFQTGTVGEGSDADSLNLPGVQQQLLDAVVATGTPVVVVLTSGRPYNLGGLEDRVAAFVMPFFGGEQGGVGLANVLCGQKEPSGRLTVSVPRNAGAVPYYYNHKFKSSGTPVARHFGSRYPFGHGLSYSDFIYKNLSVESEVVEIEGGVAKISFDLENLSERAGYDVPQLYVRDQMASVVRPVKELKAFTRVHVPAKTSVTVCFEVPSDMLSFTGPLGKRMVEPGKFEIMIGASSADIRLRTEIEFAGRPKVLGRMWRMQSNCTVRPN